MPGAWRTPMPMWARAGAPSGRSSWFGLGSSRSQGVVTDARSQLAFALDAVPGGVDAGHLVAGALDEFGRHAAGRQGVRMVFPHQLAPGGAQLLVGRGARQPEHGISVRLLAAH